MDVIGHAGRSDGLDVTMLVMADHLVLLWTAPVAGNRALVGLELGPRLDLAWTRTQALAWLSERLLEREELPVAPLRAAQLREVPIRKFMSARAGHLEREGKMSSSVGLSSSGDGVGSLEREDLKHLELVHDAVRYVQALLEGRSPAEVIARARSISKRSAEGRIARARQVGLLTPARGTGRSGELTDRARDLVRKLKGSTTAGED